MLKFLGQRVFERLGAFDVSAVVVADGVAVFLPQRRRQLHLRRGLQARQPAAGPRSQSCLRPLVQGLLISTSECEF